MGGRGLIGLGPREDGGRIHVALVDLGEANLRRIHEMSGVLRPRIHDLLPGFTARDFVAVHEGSPLIYSSVPPETVVPFLKRDLDAGQTWPRSCTSRATGRSSGTSNCWSRVSAGRRSSSVSIRRDRSDTGGGGAIASIARDRVVRVLFPKGLAVEAALLEGAAFYESGVLEDSFGGSIFKRVSSTPIDRDGTGYRRECAFIADVRESMLVYARNGIRIAMIITRPGPALLGDT